MKVRKAAALFFEVVAPSILVILLAAWLARQDAFRRLSAVASDEISRRLGYTGTGPVVLLRIDRSFSASDLQSLIPKAVDSLAKRANVAALGIDIDFSAAQYSALGQAVAKWNSENPLSAAHVIWATGYDTTGAHAPPQTEPEVCSDCESNSCKLRLRPLPLLGGALQAANYGVAYVWTDPTGVARSSVRFVCSSDTINRLPTLHTQLVNVFCQSNPGKELCTGWTPHQQNVARVDTWYETAPVDFCSVITCEGASLGAPLGGAAQLENRIVILYRDIAGCDEHATIAGTRKGSEIVASLVMNELRHGASNHTITEALHVFFEVVATLLLIALFHLRYTEPFAVFVSGILFVLYIAAFPRFTLLFPDLRDYVLALMVAFVIEIWVKASIQGFHRLKTSHDEGTPLDPTPL